MKKETSEDSLPRSFGIRYGSIPTVTHDESTEAVGGGEGRYAVLEEMMEKGSKWRVLASGLAAITLVAVFVAISYSSPPDASYGAVSSVPLLGSSRKKKSHLVLGITDETELYYKQQFVDHIYVDTEHTKKQKTYSQRYYKKSKHFKGPGHPILVVLGGEDALDLPMLYPFVHEGLAKEFGAFVLSPEHRFYGKSQPVHNPSNDDLVKYLTPDQALLDVINLLQYVREELGCSTDRSSPDYCPVISFGGSYPGFLSSMLRFRFPDHVDISYAASAPLELYSQKVNSDAYYDKVTEVTEKFMPGCAEAARSTLTAAVAELNSDPDLSVKHAAESIGICSKTLPKYMKDVATLASEVIVYLVPAIFADYNMAYYPPRNPQAGLTKACNIFQDESLKPLEAMTEFYKLRAEVEYKEKKPKCFDLQLELPTGPHARIMGADWSGSGGGYTGEIWEFQCCKDLVIRSGYSEESMFIPRHWEYHWHVEHCNERFPGVPVDPFRMLREWKFDDLSETSRILFTNGLNDGWSTSSILETDNPNLAVINFPNGAHHSELSGVYPNPVDTDDVKAGYDTITTVLSQWLEEIYSQRVVSS